VTIDEVWTGWLDLLHLHTLLGTACNYSATAYLHILQFTTAPSKAFPACCVFNSRSLATASNGGDSSAPRAQVFPVQPPVQKSCQLSTLLSLPCRAQLRCQHSTDSLPSLLNYLRLPILNWLVAPIAFPITTLHGPTRKLRFQQFLCRCYRRLQIRCIETAVFWFTYCTATAVLVTILRL
jgi:hypothetical protein